MAPDQSPDSEQAARRGKSSSKTASSTSPPKAAQAKGKSKATVCDHCRYRKISCDLQLPCSGCVFRKRTCTYDGVDPQTRSAKLESIEAEKTAREDAVRNAKEQMGDLLGKVEALAFRLRLDADQLNDLYFKAMQLVDEDKKKHPALYIPSALGRSSLPPLPTKASDAPDSPPPAGRTRAALAAKAEPPAHTKSPPAPKVKPLVVKSPPAPKVAPFPVLTSSQHKTRPPVVNRPPPTAPDVPRKTSATVNVPNRNVPTPVVVPYRNMPTTVVVPSKSNSGDQPTVIHIPASAYATYSPDEPVKRLPLHRPLPSMKATDLGHGPPPLPPIDLTGRPHNSLLFHFPATAIRSASWMGPPNTFPSVFRKPQQARYHPYRCSSSDSSSSIEIISP
ncbi:fungal specific transcription factor [Rhodotorula toruloides]|uniref:Fungal specific transcription factor n=1 Tax=Rhodotorula toruloides TaxID=5286 RepID=A0A511K959_RHOTO|nr:fungal specific transcription factor [Rhodotorula toruloides]